MIRKAFIALVLLTTTAQTDAAPARKSFAQKVAEAKATMRDSADSAFVETWNQMQSRAETAQLTASQVRSVTYWTTAGFTLGICLSSSKAADMADWHTKFDTLDFGVGEIAGHARQLARSGGLKVYQDATTSDALAKLTAAEKAQLCAVELEAERQFLRDF